MAEGRCYFREDMRHQRCDQYRPYGRCGSCGSTGAFAKLADSLGVDPNWSPYSHAIPRRRPEQRSRRRDGAIPVNVRTKPKPLSWPTYRFDGKEYELGDTLPGGELVACGIREQRLYAYPIESGGMLIEKRQSNMAAAHGWRIVREVPLFEWTGEPDLVEVTKP